MKHDDNLLRELGRLAREDLPLADGPIPDPRWDALARGMLSDEEQEDLRVEAAASPDGGRLWEAFRPFAVGFEGRVLKRIDETRLATDDADVVPFPAAAPTPSPRWRRYSPTLALAAVLLLAVGLWRFGGERAAVAPIPRYELRMEGVGATRSTSGEENAASRLVPGKRFTILLRPERDVSGPVLARVFARGADGAWREWGLARDALETAPNGSLRLSAVLDASLDPGLRSLAFAVGLADALPSAARLLEDLAAGEGASGEGWTWYYAEVEVAVPEEPRE